MKAPVSESLFELKKRLAHVFSCEFYEIFKDMLFNRTPPVAASRTCVIMGDSILNDLTEENLSKQYNFSMRKFLGATVDDLNHPVHPIFRKNRNTSFA